MNVLKKPAKATVLFQTGYNKALTVSPQRTLAALPSSVSICIAGGENFSLIRIRT
jgi:hypothetical protein